MTAPLESSDARRKLSAPTLMRLGAMVTVTGLAVGFSAVAGITAAYADDPVNTPPVAQDDYYTTPYETVLTVNDLDGVLGNDSDDDFNDLDAVSWSAPTAGTLLGYNGSFGNFEFEPPAGFSGEVTFTYYAYDGLATSAVPATVHITVGAAPNNIPVVVDDSYTIGKNQTLVVSAPGVLGNDSDADGDSLYIAAYTMVGGLLPGESLYVSPEGGVNFTPATDFTGTREFSYTASDGKGLDDNAVATIEVTEEAVEQAAPIGGADSFTTPQDTALVVPAPGLFVNDSDADSSFAVGGYTVPTDGDITVFDALAGTFTYVPDPGFVGEVTFTYFLRDVTNNESAPITVTITVTAAEEEETPGEETPGEETPGEETPGEETPGEETPGEETPEEETPGEETPGEETPGEETPEEETPEPQLPTGSTDNEEPDQSTTSSLASTGSEVSVLSALAALLLVGIGGVTLLAGSVRSSARQR